MKKTLIALAVLAASGASFAQSTVSVTGLIGFSAQKSLKNTQGLGQTDGNVFFKGTEDLGGGMKATFSTGFDFGGRATLGSEDTSLAIDGSFGTVTLKQYESHGAINSALISGASLSTGYDDAASFGTSFTAMRGYIGYTSPEISNTKFSLIYVNKGIQTPGTDAANGNKTVINAKFAKGALTAYGEYVMLDSAYPNATLKSTGVSTAVAGATAVTAYAIYDAGVVKVAAGYGKPSYDVATYTWGLSAPVSGALTLGVDGISYNGATGFQVAANYALSKRTNLNLSFGGINDLAQTYGGQTSTTQSRASLTHSF